MQDLILYFFKFQQTIISLHRKSWEEKEEMEQEKEEIDEEKENALRIQSR